MSNNTALGAESTKKEQILFISEAHEKFYYDKLKEVRYQDVYHKALCYCLGISDDTRRNIKSIYDFKSTLPVPIELVSAMDENCLLDCKNSIDEHMENLKVLLSVVEAEIKKREETVPIEDKTKNED